MSTRRSTATSVTTDTPFGAVDTHALQVLESGYDTTRLLAAVDTLDAVRTRLYDPEGLRDDLLRIHAMAHAIVNAATLTVTAQDESFVDQVTDLIDQIGQYVVGLLSVRDILQPLETLRPDNLTDFDAH
ncbi:Tn3 family transposase post-transcriptional regulator TnpC [Paraburkholderia sp.]|uniref:Tn3 family transposase post-transcriptional regulator TnpC n=1 Tax=Paraburkholderia sp. TaxID=1926495 RepID=UPI002D2AD00C|nr:Tn3 family transposase post-transcriptional regulator TnpC [Paraburkholderia sp.]HZZ02659.1 Tn3 family transposase post-transcriptional regulator TnpC [Paraburkholderia sp.]